MDKRDIRTSVGRSRTATPQELITSFTKLPTLESVTPEHMLRLLKPMSRAGSKKLETSSSTLMTTLTTTSSPALPMAPQQGDWDTYIRRELACLGTKGVTLERLNLFREVGRGVLEQISPQSLRAPLARVFREYDKFIHHHEARWTASEKNVKEIQVYKETREVDLTSQINDLQKEVERLNTTIASMRERTGTGPSYFELEDMHQTMEKKYKEERTKVNEMKEHLVHALRVKDDFQHTLRSLEDAFNIMNTEKDLKLFHMNTQLKDMAAQIALQQQTTIKEKGAVQEHAASIEIQYHQANNMKTILMERVRHQDKRIADFIIQVQKLQDELLVLDDNFTAVKLELETLKDEGGGQMKSRLRDALVTPRPNKAEALAAIPDLESTEKYPTTQSMLSVIYELCSRAQWKAKELENIVEQQYGKMAEDSAHKAKLTTRIEELELLLKVCESKLPPPPPEEEMASYSPQQSPRGRGPASPKAKAKIQFQV